MEPSKDGSAWKKWYDNHKEELAQKRRDRYKNDPEYRKKALENKRRQMEKKKQGEEPIPPEYSYTLKSMAKAHGITIWTLREWRKKEYFPEPKRFGRSLYFTEAQAALLHELHAFLQSKGVRISKEDKEELESKVSYVHANW